MRDFKKYEVWKIGHEFVMEVEGCGRKTDPEFARFIHISLGSAHEVEYLLMLCRDLTYLHETDYLLLDQKINMIKRKLYHLEKTINKSL
ncbi:four helix bundle protein [Dyadobacter aurulentus]|uniref:four helix bundle protein n=1 Tax=Dyadobacter sp. UC 10 TaxID=2605428 RepID=UPI0011F2480E|nr:four helix bundle protein [Dyadobacter sp. UC 10]KAA0990792.1 four helix bundle protein [Dyadobacter sp. UC 10]